DGPYVVVSALNAVMLLYMPLLSLVLPLWIVERTDAPRWTVGSLLVINTVAVVLFQVRVARGVTDLAGAARSVGRSGLVMLAACVVFMLSAGPSPWLAAVVLLVGACLLVLGEILLGAGAWEISFGLAPPHRHGQYQGYFGTGVAVARTIGPILLTTLVINGGAPGWLALGVIFLVAGLAMRPTVRWAERVRAALPGAGAAP
ncbi:MAG TPA: MFS transporter, partial [Pseudonocardia sp.]|nr:MFS transporter [Pseudonocardia sp.]